MKLSYRPHHTQIVERTMYNSGLSAGQARAFKEVAKHFGDGLSIATACAKAGVSMRMWYYACHNYPRVEMWHQMAVKRRADAVAQAVFELSTGKAGKRKEEFDADGMLRSTTVEVLPPDISAAKYYLNNVAPAEWRDKVDIQHSGAVDYKPLEITVKPVEIDAIDATVTETKAQVVDL